MPAHLERVRRGGVCGPVAPVILVGVRCRGRIRPKPRDDARQLLRRRLDLIVEPPVGKALEQGVGDTEHLGRVPMTGWCPTGVVGCRQ